MESSNKENVQLFSRSPIGKSPVSECSAKGKKGCFGGLKRFLGALSFIYFAKALSGSYLKSTITQIERRFEIPSSLVGVIDGSFEIGNLLVITLVSYFGAKLHRPKIIGTGCLIMSVGTFLIAMPHFFMGRYTYERPLSRSSNSTINTSPCLQDFRNQELFSTSDKSHVEISAGCDGDVGASLWVYVLLGNLLRGIGEAPIQPLGISYIDDYASEDNAGFYIGCVQSAAVIGPIFGFLLGSLCAKIFVDIGAVDMGSLTITPTDVRWVGAWWLGYLIAGGVSVLATIPFWFLPKEQPRSENRNNSNFLPSLKDLLGNPVYFLYLCGSIFQYNSLIGMVTYKPKYIEQQYGQNSSKTNFIIGCDGPVLQVFYNCTCVEAAVSYSGSSSAVAGSCAKGKDCSKMFLYFVVISAITSFTLSCGGTPGYILLLRCIKPELKSFALGIYTMVIRVLAGIPAPIYLGALIDTVCLKWGNRRCGGKGACRLYDTNGFRYIYLGITAALGTAFIFLSAAVFFILRKRCCPTDENVTNNEYQTSALSQNGNLTNNGHLIQATIRPQKETRL
ncbi:hypothetical protein FKM82_011492 [Ascaphus truei]